MGEDVYILPSGLARVVWYNRFTNLGEINYPTSAKDKNKALQEALLECARLTVELKELRDEVSRINAGNS
jgi:hypothetical protein